MSVVVAVLLVPAAGDPAGFLADGPCGSIPPRCYLSPVGEWRSVRHRTHTLPVRKFALPLWWDGGMVSEGIDRALRCAGLRFERDCTTVEGAIELATLLDHADRWGDPKLIDRSILLVRDRVARLVELA